MRGPSPRRLWKYVTQRLRLGPYLYRPGDGRLRPQIPAKDLLWAWLLSILLRDGSFHAIEALVHAAAPAVRVSRCFGDDALGYFSERVGPARTRGALAAIVQRAKRNKAFAGHLIGLALDGTGAGRSRAARCRFCWPQHDSAGQICGYHHRLVAVSVVGTGLSLPVDVEPYGPEEGEVTAAQRLLERAVGHLGRRFAAYVVGDSEYAGAPFLHVAGALGLRVVVRLKANLPTLWEAARARFLGEPPTDVVEIDGERVELWDAEDFDPWEPLQWATVRVVRYRQWKRNGTVVEAYWLTDFPMQQVRSVQLYHLAKSRWEIENQGFNDGKNRYGLAHICRHEANSLVIGWLLICLAITIERLYRLRYLRRGTHLVRAAIEFVRQLRRSLGAPVVYDTS